ncbi:nicotinamide phosphoribosyltransferase [Ixodes scapularis]
MRSTMTPWSEAGEAAACRNALQTFPSGPASVVSDSYNVFNCCEHTWGQKLRRHVIARAEHHGGLLIIRIDSGDAPEVVVEVLETLARCFPVSENEKGYRMLPDYLRLLHSDGVTLEMADAILANVKANRWSAANVLLASDGTLLQRLDRNTLRFALQCSAATICGEERQVFQKPVTDIAKKSKKGRLTLQRNCNEYSTAEQGKGAADEDHMLLVFENGHLLIDHSLEDIRNRSETVSVGVTKT